MWESLVIYKNLAIANNITPPADMRIWMLGFNSHGWLGCTPMFHHFAEEQSTIIGALIGSLIHAISDYNATLSILHLYAIPIALFIPIQFPDMLLFFEQSTTLTTQEVYLTVFHELAHSSHFYRVNETYWQRYVDYAIANYGYGNDCTGQYAGYCGIGEMWGNFAEAVFYQQYCGISYPYVQYNSSNNIFNPFEGWYHPGILAYIHNEANTNIGTIYHALNPDVYSLDALRISLHYHDIDDNYSYHAFDYFNYWN